MKLYQSIGILTARNQIFSTTYFIRPSSKLLITRKIYIFRIRLRFRRCIIEKTPGNQWHRGVIVSLLMVTLKGKCHEFFPLFFLSKDSIGDPNEQAKTVSRTISFSRRYFILKIENWMYVSAYPTTTLIRCLRIVNNYFDTCLRIQRLRW